MKAKDIEKKFNWNLQYFFVISLTFQRVVRVTKLLKCTEIHRLFFCCCGGGGICPFKTKRNTVLC